MKTLFSLGLVFVILATSDSGFGADRIALNGLERNSNAQPRNGEMKNGDAKKAPRQRRGGPDQPSVTPEGQSDLIKVLQPGANPKSK